MSMYEETLLAARFAALAPEPLTGDWEDVRERAGTARKLRPRFGEALQRRRRRPAVVLAVLALVLVVGAASALAVRAYVFHRGIVGLAPAGSTPSAPTRGELVLGFSFGHTLGDMGRFNVSVYADGRMIWQRVGDHSRTDEYRESTGLLEQRLTPEGVDLVKAEVLSTGLVDHELVLHGNGVKGLYFGYIDFRSGGRSVHVIWGDGLTLLDVGPAVPRQMPTAEQASALVRLDARLSDPASWLPASAWEDPQVRAYVPSAYSVCLQGKQGLELSRVLALLPPKAQDLLRAQENRPSRYTNLTGTYVEWCSHLTNDEARTLERDLDEAGVSGEKDVFGVIYGPMDMTYADATEFALGFSPLPPDNG